MKSLLRLFATALLFGLSPCYAQEQVTQDQKLLDKTLSPYFFIPNADADSEQFPLKSTSADVSIAGNIADVRVTQVYQNRGTKPLEGIYVFPASSRAAVYKVSMRIGDRLIEAKIKEKKQAKIEYQAAKNEGKSASLLEQERPNVFRMSIANIMPNDEIQVELAYAELLVPNDGVYEFDYPTVVGPRYSNRVDETSGSQSPEPAQNWVKNPYLQEGETVPYDFDFKAHINAGMPLSDVISTSHKVNVNFDAPTQASIELAKSETSGGNRDLILRYRLADKRINSGLLLYEGQEENFFLMMLEPPKRIEATEIVPREYIFVLDVSGSMYGFPVETAKALLRDLIAHLRPSDHFNVVLFAGASSLLSPSSLQATAENLNRAIKLIDKQQGGGGTELLPALKRAMALPKAENSSRSIVVITDGFIDAETESFDLVRKNLGNANLFSFGIGSSVNRFLVEGLARAGAGEPFIATGPAEARDRAREFREYIDSPVLTNIKVSYEGFDVSEISPEILPDLFARKPVVQFGKWKGPAKGTITITGNQGSNSFKQTIDVGATKPERENQVLRYLWARDMIAELSDYVQVANSQDLVSKITNLGLTYNLLTRYTSFIAIDQIVRAHEDGTTAKQPLPLPQGVSNNAVGAEVPAVPEPETWALMIVALLSFGVAMHSRREVRA
ncbi:MAG: VWA domain-containing protein [Deltaproteobacteria bacterium]|nr:VWA domain-containing protein [Deltaproteobacteria bacterium]